MLIKLLCDPYFNNVNSLLKHTTNEIIWIFVLLLAIDLWYNIGSELTSKRDSDKDGNKSKRKTKIMRIADEFIHTSLSKLIFVMFRPKAYLRSCDFILVVDMFTKRIYISGCIAYTYTVGPVLPNISANMHLNAKHSI